MGRVKIVRASAGSGKTYRLAYEYVRRALVDSDAYRRILAVTFTNKATDEMKRRIIREINDLSNEKTTFGAPPAFAAELQKELGLSAQELSARARRLRTRILHDYSRFTILTIDKFFQRIIRAFVRELGVENDFTLELQTDSVLAQAADRLIEETLTDDELRRWIGRYLEEQLDEGRRWDIAREFVALGQEIFREGYRGGEETARERRERLQAIVSDAAAQVGKVERRMAEIACEALQILESENLTSDDFPYKKSGFIQYFYKVAAGDTWSGYGLRVADALGADDKWFAKTSPRRGDIQALIPRLKPLLADICALYDKYRSFARTTALLRENFRAYALLNDLERHVRQACEERNVMLISETNRIIQRLIDGNDTPFIFEKAGNHFDHFLIDEFQDTSAAQWANFRPLLANAVAQSADDPVLLVGDAKQSIYRWRGGDWRILGEEAARAFAEVEELTLEKNYRSRANVVRFNNEMISSVVQTSNAELNEALAQAERVPHEQREQLTDMLARAYTDARQAAREEYAGQGFVRWTQFDPAQEEARRRILVGTVEELQRRGFRAADTAILVRSNAEAAEAAACLLDHKSAHPESPFVYDVITQEALIVGRSPAVRFVAAAFRLAVDPHDSISRALFLKTLGRPIAGELTRQDRTTLSGLRNVSPEEAFEQVLLEYRPDRQPGSTAYLQAFHDQLLAFSQSRIADIPLFLRWWDEQGAGESIQLPGGQNAVSILTIHKAKGLEFPAVILPYASWNMAPRASTTLWAQVADAPFDALGPMPVSYQRTMAESGFSADFYREWVFSRIDNVNLLYVALTRAVEELHLISPQVKKAEGSRMHHLLLRSVRAGEAEVSVGDYRGEISENEGDLRYEWGVPVQRSSAAESERPLAREGYPAFRFAGKLRLKREAERYRDEEGAWQLSPRQYGRLMHRVFEAVATEAEIAPTLARFEAEGILSAEDRASVEGRIAEAFADPLIRSWFDGSWAVVRNESELIVPGGSASIRRPDRVMIGPDRVVVIDYKFGERVNDAHARQVGEYMRFVREMGDSRVEGYVWYVRLNRVVAV